MSLNISYQFTSSLWFVFLSMTTKFFKSHQGPNFKIIFDLIFSLPSNQASHRILSILSSKFTYILPFLLPLLNKHTICLNFPAASSSLSFYAYITLQPDNILFPKWSPCFLTSCLCLCQTISLWFIFLTIYCTNPTYPSRFCLNYI